MTEREQLFFYLQEHGQLSPDAARQVVDLVITAGWASVVVPILPRDHALLSTLLRAEEPPTMNRLIVRAGGTKGRGYAAWQGRVAQLDKGGLLEPVAKVGEGFVRYRLTEAGRSVLAHYS